MKSIKYLLCLVLLCTVAQGAWAQTDQETPLTMEAKTAAFQRTVHEIFGHDNWLDLPDPRLMPAGLGIAVDGNLVIESGTIVAGGGNDSPGINYAIGFGYQGGNCGTITIGGTVYYDGTNFQNGGESYLTGWPNPGTTMPYIDVKPTTYACDEDCEYYNKIIDTAETKHECKGEEMYSYQPQYNYGIATDFNKECIYPNGSAIFIHVKGSKPYTGGCISFDEDRMVEILKNCDMSLVIKIRE